MLVHFGIQLDSLHPVDVQQSLVGETTVGGQGLLRLLETELGLPPVLAHPVESLMAYRSCLEQTLTPARFYARSFAVDALSVTRTLMNWREQWYEGGWDGAQLIVSSPRLHDMLAVEELARQQVPLCIGQRVQRVTATLATARTQINTLVLHDDAETLPAVWRRLLAVLGKTASVERAAGVDLRAAAPAATDLGKIQRQLKCFALQPQTELAGKTQLQQDGSFVLVRATSRDVSARFVAEYIRQQAAAQQQQTLQPDMLDCVVVAEQDGIIIDNAMERSGLPRCGFQHLSRFRPLAQVLKLALGLLWAPASPHLLLQFLLHPLGPLPKFVRRLLADAVAQQPGIGGAAWQQALAQIQQQMTADDVPVSGADAVQRMLAQIAYWLDSPRSDVEAGIPVDVVQERIGSCSAWLAGMLKAQTEQDKNGTNRQLYIAALAQAGALSAACRALQSSGQTHIDKVELDRLLHDVTRPATDISLYAEAGHVAASESAESLTSACDMVVWWDLQAAQEAKAVRPLPWSAEELLELQAAGVDLQDTAARLHARACARLRPLLNCRQQLVLVVHHSEEGQHPLWSQLDSAFSGWQQVNLEEQLLESPAVQDAGPALLTVPLRALPTHALPSPKPAWQLPAEMLTPRPVESYSSLDKLFYYPHEWVLSYAARLRAGRAEDVADGNLLYGNLAHRLFQLFFEQHQQWRELDSASVVAWLQKTLPVLITNEGAVLLEPGRGVDQQRLITVLETALQRLLQHLRAADIVEVRSEFNDSQPYTDSVAVGGDIDLLLTRADGLEVVMDAKWGGQKYRGAELADNMHLQLTTYAYLRARARQPSAPLDPATWPYAVYFIISSGDVLATDDQVFADAVVFAQDADAHAQQLWQAGLETYAWRMGQLRNGRVEIAGQRAADATLPPGVLHLSEDRAGAFDDFVQLTGWDSFA